MIRISVNTVKGVVVKEVNISTTLSGDYLLKEHPEIDIIVMPKTSKIVAIPKKDYTEYTYKIQSKLFEMLKRGGVVLPDSVKGSNVFGGMEAIYPKQSVRENQDTLQVAIYVITEFLDEERPKHVYAAEYEKAFHDALTNPSSVESTELGEVPHEEFKGSIPKSGFPNKAIYRYTY